jgi:hypothetical protein
VEVREVAIGEKELGTGSREAKDDCGEACVCVGGGGVAETYLNL